MELPLLSSPRLLTADDGPSLLSCGFSESAARMPERFPGPGEQYRFHIDMAACIGCKCCVVACNEQNGNPAAINWRRVGEIEGGWYPHTQRSYLSMGCNHCVEPTCLSGCPVDAYSKDPLTGIVRHSADTCIGCQYCTWNCSYGVPQYNADRGVVGKCDMCYGRLELGQAPACVSACPEGAIRIEIVNIAEWRAASGGGAPENDGSVSTTRVSLPDALPPNARPTDQTHVRCAEPHWPLVAMTVLTQLSVGALATIWMVQLLGASTRLGLAAVVSLMVAGCALAGSTLHLGRPIHAYRALRMWKRSWLSREVLLFSTFSLSATLYAAALWFGPAKTASAAFLGGLTTVLGLAGVWASACIYRVPSRPAWNSRFTIVYFALTAAVLGPLFVAALGAGDPLWLGAAAASAGAGQMVLLALRFFRLIASGSIELRGTARLLSTTLRPQLLTRGALLGLGGIVLPLQGLTLIALGLAFAGELLGRYLFFVSVVPKHMTAPYLAESEAA